MWESAGVLVFDASFPAKGCVDQKSRGTVTHNGEFTTDVLGELLRFFFLFFLTI
jgi:hypothetical protein